MSTPTTPQKVRSIFYVAAADGNVLWTESAEEAALGRSDRSDRTVAKAYELQGLPWVRHHENFEEIVRWSIRVTEIEDRGDLLLALPHGFFRLHARHARRGETTGEVTITPFGIGVGSPAGDSDSAPAFIDGLVRPPERSREGWSFQASSITYEDGTHSGFLGCYVQRLDLVDPTTNPAVRAAAARLTSARETAPAQV